MPTDAHLYPHHKPKNTPREISTSSSLAFASTLSSLLSASSSATARTAPGRPRPSKTSKADIFTAHNKNTKKRAARDLEEEYVPGSGRAWKQDIGSVDDALLHRSKRKLEQKAKKYNSMKRGDLGEGTGEGETLVDFDRKWAERNGDEDAESEIESDDGQGSIVNYEDEYGRARRGTRAEAQKIERRKRNKLLGAEELDRMSARPAQPQNLIFGDAVQSLAFNPDGEVAEKMDEIARKRDRSATPPESKHYEADKEFRIKGVGFYSFSKDKEVRAKEMEALEREREETERFRKDREEKKEQRKREIEERRRAIGEKRARKQADNFLEGMAADIEKSGVE